MPRSEPVRQKPRRPLILSAFILAIKFPFMVLVAALVSAVMELLGMLVGLWPLDHSHKILSLETGWLNAPVRLGPNPIETTISVLQTVNRLIFIDSGVMSLAYFIGIPTIYIEAMSNSMQITALRVLVIIYNLLPLAIMGALAVNDGLIEREIRKYCADIDHDLPFHVAYRWLLPVAPWLIILYLAAPFAVKPSHVFLPIVGVIWAASYITARNLLRFI